MEGYLPIYSDAVLAPWRCLGEWLCNHPVWAGGKRAIRLRWLDSGQFADDTPQSQNRLVNSPIGFLPIGAADQFGS